MEESVERYQIFLDFWGQWNGAENLEYGSGFQFQFTSFLQQSLYLLPPPMS